MSIGDVDMFGPKVTSPAPEILVHVKIAGTVNGMFPETLAWIVKGWLLKHTELPPPIAPTVTSPSSDGVPPFWITFWKVKQTPAPFGLLAAA